MCRFTTADRGRKGTISINGVRLTEVTVAEKADKADANGFYNLEIPLDSQMLKDDNGSARQKLTFRFEASGSTRLPGLYYLRLLKR